LEIEPLLSAKILSGLVTDNPTSLKYFSNYRACVVAFENAINSASTIDNATVSCLLHSQETGPLATMNILPLVDCCKGDRSRAPGDSSVNYNLCNIVTTYLQEIPQRIR